MHDPFDEPPEPTCPWCEDCGSIDIFHPSTDGLIGSRPCPALNDPVKHPPAPPTPVSLVKAHRCADDQCCPPF